MLSQLLYDQHRLVQYKPGLDDSTSNSKAVEVTNKLPALERQRRLATQLMGKIAHRSNVKFILATTNPRMSKLIAVVCMFFLGFQLRASKRSREIAVYLGRVFGIASSVLGIVGGIGLLLLHNNAIEARRREEERRRR